MAHSKNIIKWIDDQYKFVYYCNSFLPENKKIKLYFRGQSKKYDNNFLPSLYRNDFLKYNINNIYSEILAKFPNEFREEKTIFDKLVKMQHFKIPTKLLDVTEDPLVALYFASRDDHENDGVIFSFFVSNNSIIYSSNPISIILSYYFEYESKQNLYDLGINIDISRQYKKYNMYELINVKNDYKKEYDFAFASPFDAAKNEIKFNERMYCTSDLIGIFNIVPNYNNPRIARQRSSFLVGGLSKEDSLLKNILRKEDVKMFVQNLNGLSFEKILKNISKKTFSDKNCKKFLKEFLKNFIGTDLSSLDKDLPYFTIETYKELYSERVQQSSLYLEYLLFLYGLYGFEGKFSFYDSNTIPSNTKHSLLETLELHGTTEGFLFPDLEHFAKDIKDKYKL